MGSIIARDPGQRLLPPDTPPDLVSPTATTFSTRSSPTTEAAWQHRSLASPPMSSYDRSPAATMPGEKQAEAPRLDTQAAPRQQLPSLSSLFGPPSATRSMHSPMSERHGSFPTTSPLDRARFASNERGQTDSYFPPTMSPPISHPRPSNDHKVEAERPVLHPLRRSTSGPGSPRFRQSNHGRVDSRSEQDHASRFTPQINGVGSEYHSVDARDSPFRASRDQFRLQFPGPRHHSGNYSDHRPSSASLNPPPTPTATIVTSDGIPAKDGLGPKIWTGTHFLPRFVRAAEVPGEGLCYFYDDGTHCKTVIDGEVVNAHWGVTKAGKPRKRLAIACITCREKKIKCDPDYPRCVQCEKFGRICKFKNAPRGGHNTSPSTPPPELDELRKPGDVGRSHDYRLSESESGSPVSPRAVLPPPTEDVAGPNKRLKLSHEGFIPSGEPSPALSRHLDHAKSPILMQKATPEMTRIADSVLSRAWQTDPAASSNPQSINAAISQFFVHIDSTMMLRFFPEQSTKAWVAGPADRKSPEDLMLLYSMLAIGMALSGGPKKIAWEYAQVAHYAQRNTTAHCLQLAQSRILLAVYYISISRRSEANDMLSAAAATAAALQLNLEFENSRQAAPTTYPLGLNKAGFYEARRRTLWSLFILERLSGMYPSRLAMINAEDVYVRLPADSRTFEEQVESYAPVFNPHELSLPRTSEQHDEIAAYFVEIVHFWAEGQSTVHKFTNRPASLDAEAARVRGLVGSMDRWRAALPARLHSTYSNLEGAALAGNTGIFLTMHLLYYHAMIRLHRYNRAPRLVARDSRSVLVQRSFDYASRIVETVEMLDRLLRARPMTLSVPPPMVAVAIIEAVDVLSARQPLTHIHKVMDSIRMMKPLVDTMGGVWEESRAIRYAIERRLRILGQIGQRGARLPSPNEGYRIEEKGEVRWEMLEPMEDVFDSNMDIFYMN